MTCLNVKTNWKKKFGHLFAAYFIYKFLSFLLFIHYIFDLWLFIVLGEHFGRAGTENVNLSREGVYYFLKNSWLLSRKRLTTKRYNFNDDYKEFI